MSNFINQGTVGEVRGGSLPLRAALACIRGWHLCVCVFSLTVCYVDWLPYICQVTAMTVYVHSDNKHIDPPTCLARQAARLTGCCVCYDYMLTMLPGFRSFIRSWQVVLLSLQLSSRSIDSGRAARTYTRCQYLSAPVQLTPAAACSSVVIRSCWSCCHISPCRTLLSHQRHYDTKTHAHLWRHSAACLHDVSPVAVRSWVLIKEQTTRFFLVIFPAKSPLCVTHSGLSTQVK